MTTPNFSDAPANAPDVNPNAVPGVTDSRDARIADLERQLADAKGQNVPQTPEDAVPEFYVWLVNGEVVRVKESELPPYGGTNAVNGHYEKDGNSFLVVGVYPVETKVGK